MPVIKLPGLKESDGVVNKTIPAGTYLVRISNIETKESGDESKYPKSTYLNFTAKVAEEGESKGETIFFMCSLPDERMDASAQRKSVDKFKCICNACDLNVESDDFDTQDLIGQSFRAVVIQSEYKGKPKNEVTDFLKAE